MNQEFETLFITSVCDMDFDGHKKINTARIPLTYFDLYQEEWSFMERYYSAHGTYPSRGVLTDEFPDFMPEEPKSPPDYYIKQLTDRHNYGILNNGVEKITKLMTKPGYDSVEDAINIFKGMSDKFAQATSASADTDITQNFRIGLDDYYAGEGTGDIFPVPYQGLIDNSITPHFMSGELIVLFARMGFGKSWLCMWFALHDWWFGHDTLILTPEMTVKQFVQRRDALLFGLNYTRSTFKNLSDEELEVYEEAIQKLEAMDTARMIICPLGDFNSSRIKSWDYIRVKIEQYGCPSVYVDSAHLLFGVNGLNFVEEAYTLSRQTKQIAKNTNTKIFLTVQAGREAEGKKKGGGLASIQWGDAFAQDGDFVIELIGKRGSDIRELDFIKTRRGQEGKITINYKFEPMDLTEIIGFAGADEDSEFDPDDVEDDE